MTQDLVDLGAEPLQLDLGVDPGFAPGELGLDLGRILTRLLGLLLPRPDPRVDDWQLRGRGRDLRGRRGLRGRLRRVVLGFAGKYRAEPPRVFPFLAILKIK